MRWSSHCSGINKGRAILTARPHAVWQIAERSGRLLDDPDFVGGQAVEFPISFRAELVDLPDGRVDLPLENPGVITPSSI